MVTYSDLFEFVIMLIAFATFIYKISKKITPTWELAII